MIMEEMCYINLVISFKNGKFTTNLYVPKTGLIICSEIYIP